MWTTAEVKGKAKAVLRGRYWPLFWLTLPVAVVGANHYQILNQINIFLRLFGRPVIPVAFDARYWATIGISLALSVFVTDILNVGLCRVYLFNHGGQLKPGELLYGFRSGYLHVFWVQLSTNLIVLFFTLLLLVPGVIMGYRYRMVPYLLSENPKLSGREARKLSARITDGQKAALFWLDLTFIGWRILGTLCLLVGTLFVQPYFVATYAEVYLLLRDQNAIIPAEGLPKEESV
jgi:Predicted integral membrane protein